MKSTEELVKKLRAFQWLDTLALSKRSHSYECDLTLNLSNHEHGGESLSLTFYDVSNLTLLNVGGGYVQLSDIQIEHIGAQQLDRKRFRVTQLEDDKLKFDCADFSISD